MPSSQILKYDSPLIGCSRAPPARPAPRSRRGGRGTQAERPPPAGAGPRRRELLGERGDDGTGLGRRLLILAPTHARAAAADLVSGAPVGDSPRAAPLREPPADDPLGMDADQRCRHGDRLPRPGSRSRAAATDPCSRDRRSRSRRARSAPRRGTSSSARARGRRCRSCRGPRCRSTRPAPRAACRRRRPSRSARAAAAAT